MNTDKNSDNAIGIQTRIISGMSEFSQHNSNISVFRPSQHNWRSDIQISGNSIYLYSDCFLSRCLNKIGGLSTIGVNLSLHLNYLWSSQRWEHWQWAESSGQQCTGTAGQLATERCWQRVMGWEKALETGIWKCWACWPAMQRATVMPLYLMTTMNDRLFIAREAMMRKSWSTWRLFGGDSYYVILLTKQRRGRDWNFGTKILNSSCLFLLSLSERRQITCRKEEETTVCSAVSIFAGGMVRLTAELVQKAPSYINPLKDRELDLCGNQTPLIENLAISKVYIPCGLIALLYTSAMLTGCRTKMTL